MPKIASELSALAVKRLNNPGWHAVGGVAGLLLQVKPPAIHGGAPSRSWLLRLRIAGTRKLLGLGPYPEVSLAEAREQARKLSQEVRTGVDIVARKRAERSAAIAAAAKQKTFEECAAEYMKAHATDYSNEKHRKQWASTLATYAYPVIGRLLVADISRQHVMGVLQQTTSHRNGESGPLWTTKPETAKRLLDRIRVVLDYAAVHELRSGTNPATWKGYLDALLPSPRGIKPVVHHKEVPYPMAGDFMQSLRRKSSISAKAAEFLLLTGVRSGSVRKADWSEIDFTLAVWNIPAGHTKARKEHRVPLARQALQLLQSLPRFAGTTKIFPNQQGKAMSGMALNQLMRRMRKQGEPTDNAVPHGLRSTFRTWSAERTDYHDELRKAASGHVVGDAVKEAYQRSDLLEKRRRMMQDWADFLDKPSAPVSATVAAIRSSA